MFFKACISLINRTEYTLISAKKSPCDEGDMGIDGNFTPFGEEAKPVGKVDPFL
jgi:hypothetical protein